MRSWFVIYVVVNFNSSCHARRPNLLLNKNSNAYLSDPETRIACLFARCRCDATRAGILVWPAAAAAAAVRHFAN